MRSFLVAAALLTTFGSVALAGEPAMTKQFVIEVCLYHGDPLGSKTECNLEILSHPRLVTMDGQAASCMVGQKVTALETDGCDFVGTSFNVRPVARKDGVIRVELGCKVSEIVEQSEFHLETRTLGARRIINVRLGETFKMRLKGQSATEQTWLEGKVTEVTEVESEK
jgi:hypothetical protein